MGRDIESGETEIVESVVSLAAVIDADAGQAMSLGHTIVITENGREVLSRLTPDYHVCR